MERIADRCVISIADEVDLQLSQTMVSFMAESKVDALTSLRNYREMTKDFRCEPS